jgi:DNA-binding MarR family transcriptional regulator
MTKAADRETLRQDEIANSLRIVVMRVGRRLRQQSTIGLTPTLTAALGTISREGPITLGALAAIEHVAPPSITKVVAKLVDEGLILRRVDDSDRRIVWVELTVEGRRQLDEARNRNTVWLASRLQACSPAELACLADAAALMERVILDEAQEP